MPRAVPNPAGLQGPPGQTFREMMEQLARMRLDSAGAQAKNRAANNAQISDFIRMYSQQAQRDQEMDAERRDRFTERSINNARYAAEQARRADRDNAADERYDAQQRRLEDNDALRLQQFEQRQQEQRWERNRRERERLAESRQWMIENGLATVEVSPEVQQELTQVDSELAALRSMKLTPEQRESMELQLKQRQADLIDGAYRIKLTPPNKPTPEEEFAESTYTDPRTGVVYGKNDRGGWTKLYEPPDTSAAGGGAAPGGAGRERRINDTIALRKAAIESLRETLPPGVPMTEELITKTMMQIEDSGRPMNASAAVVERGMPPIPLGGIAEQFMGLSSPPQQFAPPTGPPAASPFARLSQLIAEYPGGPSRMPPDVRAEYERLSASIRPPR